MKKLRKFLIIGCLLFLAICQINVKVYCYTIDEVKDKIDFKIVEESGEPEDYDVLIDARDLIDNEELPCIETSIESVVYSEDDILSIDFFGRDASKNSSEEWKEFIWGPVKAILKVLLYISLAMMLTLLIYMAVIIIRSSISKKESMLPLSSVFGLGNIKDNPKKHLTEKGFVEQWIISTAMLILIVYIMNLTVSFSDVLTNIANDFKPDNDDDNSIVVYVKNSKETVSMQSITGTTTERGSVLSNDIRSYINTEATPGNWAVYAKNLATDTDVVTWNNTNKMPSASIIKLFIAAAAYEKADKDSSYRVNTSDMRAMISASNNIAANNLIDAVGGISAVNSYISDNGYTSTELNRKFGITSFEKDNYTSASDVGKLLENIYNNKCAGASEILNYMKNQERRNKIPQGISADVTIANKTGELGSNYPNGPVENDAAIVYKDNANYILVILSSNLGDNTKAITNINEISSKVYLGIDGDSGLDGSGSTNTTTRTFDYYFKTNLEGLLMFQTQYNWEDYASENVINLVAGASVTFFKVSLYGIFFIRMILVAILTAFAPLVVLVSAFMKIRGNKGYLISWLKIYLYCVFLRPIISIIYYIFIRSNIYTVSEYPLYILFVIAGIVGLFIFSLKMLLKSLNIRKNKSKKKSK